MKRPKHYWIIKTPEGEYIKSSLSDKRRCCVFALLNSATVGPISIMPKKYSSCWCELKRNGYKIVKVQVIEL